MARLRELIEEHHSLVSSLEALTDEPTSGHDPGTQSPIPPLSESRRNSREVDRAVRTARAAAAEAFVRSESTECFTGFATR
ncbi:hypothetical protein BSKO_02179 [Bryopsis sp. KO-2023]|nr:hypothetical protein BSKO_02179 [Bryopsis sp. KO-2023]